VLRSHPLRLCKDFEAESCRSNGHVQPSRAAACANEWPKIHLRVPLYCMHHTLRSLGRLQRGWHAQTQGHAVPKTPKAVPERVNRGHWPTSTHFWVRLCTLEGQAHATESTAGSCKRGSVDSSEGRLTAEPCTGSSRHDR